jgi:tyrosyl-tRNA synthetase
MDKIDELLTRGVETIIPSKKALEDVLRSGKKLRLYQGFDPTSPELHIGHLVGLRKLRQWQDLGHEVIFLLGDFTATVGDPTGKDKTRPMISEEQVARNAQTYKEQASKVLRFDGENPVLIKRNSEWLSKLSFLELAQLASKLTVQQVIERDMFQNRLKSGADVAISEFFYPLMQGYDSVAMDVDLEIGGNDQLFNMMTGRDLMHKIKQKDKFVMTTPLLADSNGKKIGKSEGNAIALTKPASEMFGMIMQLDDSVITKCFEYITTVPLGKVSEVDTRLKSGENPMILKKELAYQIVTELHSKEAADKAREEFEDTFQKGEISEDLIQEVKAGPGKITDRLVEVGIVASKSEAKRLEEQGAIKEIKPGLYRVGKKRFVKFV